MEKHTPCEHHRWRHRRTDRGLGFTAPGHRSHGLRAQSLLADGTRVRGCFALRHRTRQVLGIAFDYHMRADLVTNAIETMMFEVPGSIWHSDQGKHDGAGQTRQLLLHKGFVLSMSRAGTPTDNGYAERFVGSFKLAVADRRPYHTLGEVLRVAEAWINFYNQERPHDGLENLSPLQYVQQHGLEDIPSLALW